MQLDEVRRPSAGVVGPFVETAGLARERGDDVARVEAAFPVPRAGSVIEASETVHPVGAGLGAAHLEAVAGVVHEAVRHRMARQSEDVVDAVRLVPRRGLGAAVMAVAPHGESGVGPVPADTPHQVLQRVRTSTPEGALGAGGPPRACHSRHGRRAPAGSTGCRKMR